MRRAPCSPMTPGWIPSCESRASSHGRSGSARTASRRHPEGTALICPAVPGADLGYLLPHQGAAGPRAGGRGGVKGPPRPQAGLLGQVLGPSTEPSIRQQWASSSPRYRPVLTGESSLTLIRTSARQPCAGPSGSCRAVAEHAAYLVQRRCGLDLGQPRGGAVAPDATWHLCSPLTWGCIPYCAVITLLGE